MFECIQYSLNLFSAKGAIGRESEQEKEKTQELEEIKNVPYACLPLPSSLSLSPSLSLPLSLYLSHIYLSIY